MVLTDEQKNFRPFDQVDYYNAKQALKNMVELKIITAAQMLSQLRKLKEITQ